MRSPFRTQTISRAHKRKAPALRPGPFCVGKPGSGHSARDFAAYTPSMRIAEEGGCPFRHPRKRRIGGILHPRPRPCGRGLRASANREAGLRLATLRPTRRRCGFLRKALAPSCIPESGGLGGFSIRRPRPCGRGLRASANREAGLRPATLRRAHRRCGFLRKALAPSCIPESGGMGDFPSEGPGLAAGAFLQPFSGGIRTALRSRPPR